MMHVQAFAEGYQPSDIRSLAINILNRKNGLLKKTYKGQWNSCDEMLEEKPINNETVTNFSIDLSHENDFGHTFIGYVNVEEEGEYGL